MILSKVDTSLWASRIVSIIKANGDIRICGDFKVSINPYLVVGEYHLQTIGEQLATMAGGDKFTQIELSRAYLQQEVAPEDRHLLTLNTHKVLYQANRLLYGVASAPAIWQREIEKILQSIPGVSVFLDDIKITGPDDATKVYAFIDVTNLLQINQINSLLTTVDLLAKETLRDPELLPLMQALQKGINVRK
ncbi:hypothetical protein QE152_g9919 [Popillia japonica]|uniref:Reverse transcriptase domain-containing protein n=1 Tax=Popillia japonica TaxID=7064 RepID=A0AAW1LX12_POPJA